MLTAALSGGLVSCVSDDVAPDGNIFLNRRPPRYGHGGTENPRYRYGANREDDESAARPPRRSDTRETRTEDESQRRRRPRTSEADDSSRSNPGERDTRRSTSESRDTPPPERSTPPPREERPAPEPAKPKPASEDLPYATPVPGADGVVYSPYTNQKVDVKGMTPGSKARDPVSKKVFRVP